MAEFPYPEYRNLWPGSALSKDRSAVTDGTYRVTSEQIGDGLRLTVNEDIPGGTSLLSSISSFNPTIQPGMHWWVATFRNPGTTPFPISFGSRWFSATGSQVATSSIPITYLAPGETRTVAVGRDAAENMVSTGFWLYYAGASTNRPNAGDVIEILDGITLVEGDTAPDFPFNGDEAKPVETLKRRNLNPDPKGSSIDAYRKTTNDVMTVVTDEGEPAIQLLEGPSPNTTLYIDPATNWDSSHGLSAGKWFAHSAEVKAVNGFTNTSSSIVRIMSYNGGAIGSGTSPADYELTEDSYKRMLVSRPVTAADQGSYFRTLVWPSVPSGEGVGFRVRRWVVAVADTQADAEAAVASYFDGDTPASGNLSYRWAPDGTSLEVETIQPPTGRTTVWDGEPYKSSSTLWVGPASGVTGVFEVGISTEARLGIVSDVYSRSREKIQLKLAGVDDLVRSGHRIELAAAAMTSAPAVWTWRQITGPAVTLSPKGNTVDFIAPDVEKPATIRIGVFASSEDGRNRSNWHYFDLTVEPPMLRFRGEDGGDFTPRSPYLMGYSRGKREIWNDVVRPVTYEESPRHEVEVLDLGIPDDDVVFGTEVPRRMAAGGVWVNPETGDVFRNFGAGYNETDDTTASPRTSTYWVNPANGDILEWIED